MGTENENKKISEQMYADALKRLEPALIELSLLAHEVVSETTDISDTIESLGQIQLCSPSMFALFGVAQILARHQDSENEKAEVRTVRSTEH